MEFEIDVHRHGDHTVVTPRGEVDLGTQTQLRAVIEELVVAGEVHLVVDLSEVTFLDSTGLGALIGARRKTHAFKGSFALVCSDEHQLKVFRITGLDKVFAIHRTQAEALPVAS